MKIKKVEPSFRKGDLVRYCTREGTLADHGMGIVISVSEEGDPTTLFPTCEVYFFSKKRLWHCYFNNLTTMSGTSGGEWYEVGLGGEHDTACDNNPLSVIE